MKKLFLIDGHSLIFRSYYAFIRRPMVNSKGDDTSILFGFTKSIIDLILKERPTHLAIAFDPPVKTFRHQLYPQYKANRLETPKLIKDALEPLIEIAESISIPVLMKPGYEADDVIGTIAKKAQDDGFTVYMLTPDKDYGQLISDNIFQYKPAKGGGEHSLIGLKEINQEYGIDNPAKIIDILTIWGDASDNIPGIRGVGEVGSKKLIQKYGSVENIYNHLDELPDKQKEAFKEAKEQIELSKRLVTIDTTVDIECSHQELKLQTPHFQQLRDLFLKYEFPSLAAQIPKLREIFGEGSYQEWSNSEESSNSKFHFTINKVDEILAEAKKSATLGIISLNNRLAIAASQMVSTVEREQLLQIKNIIEDPSVLKCGYDLKSIVNRLSEEGIVMAGGLLDIELMHYLLMPEKSHNFELLANTYLGYNFNERQETQSNKMDLFSSIESGNSEDLAQKLLLQTSLAIPLAKKIETELENNSMGSLYSNIEMPLICVLSDMEQEGVKLDIEMLQDYGAKLTAQLQTIEEEIRNMADDSNLNISSPKQLQVVLYDKLKLLPLKGKKRPSTDEETLNEIIDKHPIVPAILEFRNLKKLISTYIEPMPLMVSTKTGKLHTTYNQALTATGRLSSNRPNLQNIPIRTQRGREIRKAFIPSHPNGTILSADYSQIELRLMAQMSSDPGLIEAFKNNEDIHASTASRIYSVPKDEVTILQRSHAKTANFGIIYGISSFGLSQRLNIPRSESKRLIDDYFRSYPMVKEYMDSAIEKAKQDGYVTTLFGRRRYLPDINSGNQFIRSLAERNAINAPIQGSAADIIKVAMVSLWSKMNEMGLKSKMILQVHDELVFDVFPGEEDILSQLVKKEMESVIKLSIPLIVECNHGKNWLEAH